jgi:hypothetical protein
LIGDSHNCRIRKVSATGTITTVAGNGTCGFAGDGGPATLAELSGPHRAVPTADGGYLIADEGNCLIRKVNSSGVINTVAGNHILGCGYTGDSGQATAAQLSFPRGVAPTSDGGFLIADTSNCVIRKVSSGGVITTVAGTGSCS